MTNPDAQALIAKGTPVELLDGTTVRLRYSMASLVQLEDQFGSLQGIMSAAQRAADVLDAQEKVDKRETITDEQRQLIAEQAGKPSLFGVIARIVLPGLSDAQAAHPRTGAPFYMGDDDRAAMSLLDPGKLSVYLEAFADAFRESMHLSGGGASGEAVTVAPLPAPTLAPLTAPHLSPGPSGTTPPVGPLGVPMPSSGA